MSLCNQYCFKAEPCIDIVEGISSILITPTIYQKKYRVSLWWDEKKKSLIDLQNKELLLSNKIKNLELKNSLLTDNLDLDFIEILIRQKFLFGKKEETLYIIKKNEN